MTVGAATAATLASVQEPAWTRRAVPLLGTLVEVGVPAGQGARLQRAFDRIADIEAVLSRFLPESDIGRFNAAEAGHEFRVRDETVAVLRAARELQEASGGLFDVSLGSGPQHWIVVDGWLRKLDHAVRLDLGGIGKGFAVDEAVRALIDSGAEAGWVNAGGDLRVFGDVDLPVRRREEDHGGVRLFGTLRDGALATSRFGAGSRSQGGMSCVPGADALPACQISVAAPLAMWADALTKVVALSRDTEHPLLRRFEAMAWCWSLSPRSGSTADLTG